MHVGCESSPSIVSLPVDVRCNRTAGGVVHAGCECPIVEPVWLLIRGRRSLHGYSDELGCVRRWFLLVEAVAA